jgi:protease-4
MGFIMTLTPDILIDRQKMKKKLNFWRALALLAIFIALFTILPSGLQTGNYNKTYIARININGMITENQYREEVLNKIANNNSIKAVIMHINSPGGTEVGSEILYNSLKEIATKKPLVAVLNTVAASGGYMVALAADHILAQHGTLTGSIGVLLPHLEVSELASKFGVGINVFKTSPLKGQPSSIEKVSPEAKAMVESVIMDSYDFFVELVAERRKFTKEQALKVADGRIYTGNQAKKNNLIDALGGEKEALKWLKETRSVNITLPVKEMALHKRVSPWQELILYPTNIINSFVKNLLTGYNLSLEGLITKL